MCHAPPKTISGKKILKMLVIVVRTRFLVATCYARPRPNGEIFPIFAYSRCLGAEYRIVDAPDDATCSTVAAAGPCPNHEILPIFRLVAMPRCQIFALCVCVCRCLISSFCCYWSMRATPFL